MIVGDVSLLAPTLAIASALALTAVNGAIVARQTTAFALVMLGGCLVLVAGQAAWALGRPVFQVVPSWLSFFVMTIVAERLELSRLARTPRWASRAVVVMSLALAIAAVASLSEVPMSDRCVGVLIATLGAWLVRFDLARQTIRQSGLPRFAAAGVLCGALWLVVGGSLLALGGLSPGTLWYDAELHSVFVGFVVSMVLAHAPLILPAVARVAVPFHRVLWIPLAAIQLSLAVRVAGDLLAVPAARTLGGTLNAVSLGLVFAAVLYARSSTAHGKV